jgi:hypothetical protein
MRLLIGPITIDLGRLTSLTINLLVLAFCLCILITWVLYTVWSWLDPTRLRAVEAKRIQYWPLIGGPRERERRINEIHTEAWLKLNRMILTMGTVGLFGIVTLAILLNSAPSK